MTTTTYPMMDTELQIQLNMLAQKGEEALRKQKEKLNKIWEDANKKKEEIFKKIFKT